MAANFPLSEEKLQEIIITWIKDNSLIENIENNDELQNLSDHYKYEKFLPEFSIDFLIDKKYINSAQTVLNGLSDTEIITGDKIKNISLEKDTKTNVERLYPDTILFNSETDQFILIEFKKDGQTEREAVTELMAYALEVKNHLPNIADSDILLVVVSTEFNTLLDHAVNSVLLGTNFNILAIKASYDNKLSLEVHFPKAWTDIWQNTLPEEVFSSLTLVPYQYNSIESKEIPNKFVLLDAISDIIIKKSANLGSHGFFIAWENHSDFKSHAEFCISLYQFNPFVFINVSLEAGFKLNKQEPLSKFILKYNEENSYSQPNSLFELAKEIKLLLNLYYSTSIEDLSSWTAHSNINSNFRSQAYPLYFNAWGNIGDYVYDLYYNTNVRIALWGGHNFNEPLLHKSPIFGIEIINRINGNTLFLKGSIRPKEFYLFLKQIRYYKDITDTFFHLKELDEEQIPKSLFANLYFSSIDLVSSLREITYRINSSTNISRENIPKFPIYLNNPKVDLTVQIDEWLKWFGNVFLEDNLFYKLMLSNFYNWCMIYLFPQDRIDSASLIQIRTEIIDLSRSYLLGTLSECLIEKTRNLEDEHSDFIIRNYLNGVDKLTQLDEIDEPKLQDLIDGISDEFLIRTFEDVFLELLDRTQTEVFHTLEPLPNFKSINWTMLKQRILTRNSQGFQYMAIGIEPNGNVTIHQLPESKRFLRNINPITEVYLLINESGVELVKIANWEDIESGKAFELPK